jgi:hypothetical protein
MRLVAKALGVVVATGGVVVAMAAPAFANCIYT